MSVYQDKSGQWWAVVETGASRAGKRKRAYRRVKNERDGKRIEKQIIRDRDKGITIDGREPTFQQWAEQWLRNQATRVRPKTYTGYQTAIRNYGIPALQRLKLSQIRPTHIRGIADAVKADGHTSTTARDHQQRVMKCLKDARADGHHIADGVLSVPLPARAVTDRTSIPTDQVAAVLAVIAKRDDRSRWMAALLHGMRQGEALGLTWQSLDLNRGLMDISWQLQPLPSIHGCDGNCSYKRAGSCPDRRFLIPDGYDYRVLKGRMCLVRPKTHAGQRLIPLVPWMLDALVDWKQNGIPSPHGLVWPDSDGQPQTSRDDHAQWVAIQELAGIRHANDRPWAGHEARHTAASGLLAAGVDPHTVTALLGHSSIAVSRTYMHASQQLTREALERVAATLQIS